MQARVPLDVDLEDKLLYGLTPTRLAYIVVAVLGGLALWSSPWAPSPARAASSFLVVAVGAVLAWGRWRGRPADGWMVDMALYTVRIYGLALSLQRRRPVKHRNWPASPAVEEPASAPDSEPAGAAA